MDGGDGGLTEFVIRASCDLRPRTTTPGTHMQPPPQPASTGNQVGQQLVLVPPSQAGQTVHRDPSSCKASPSMSVLHKASVEPQPLHMDVVTWMLDQRLESISLQAVARNASSVWPTVTPTQRSACFQHLLNHGLFVERARDGQKARPCISSDPHACSFVWHPALQTTVYLYYRGAARNVPIPVAA